MTSKISRRRMVKQIAAGGALAVLGSRRRAQAAPVAKIESVDVISHQPQFYLAWPSIIRRKNGQLWLVFSGGREAHVCPFGRVDSMVSYDDGRTWSWPRVLLDGVLDDRGPGMVETAQGTLLVSTYSSAVFEEYISAFASSWPADKKYRWLAARDRASAEQRKEQTGSWMIRSTDGGLSWSAPYDCIICSPHGPIQLSDGRLLHAGQEEGKPPFRRAAVENVPLGNRGLAPSG